MGPDGFVQVALDPGEVAAQPFQIFCALQQGGGDMAVDDLVFFQVCFQSGGALGAVVVVGGEARRSSGFVYLFAVGVGHEAGIDCDFFHRSFLFSVIPPAGGGTLCARVRALKFVPPS